LKLVVDDHAFTVDIPGTTGPHVCRLQVFAGEGGRSVVVATQALPPPTGASLSNGAEAFAESAWKTHLPDDDAPPTWIEHYVADPAFGQDHWMQVTFSIDSSGRLSDPRWGKSSLAEVASMVDTEVDPGRGDQYQAPAPEEPRSLKFRFVAIRKLPDPTPFRAPDCMPSTHGWLQRLWRQVFPVHTTRQCCWYHGGDWHQVTRLLVEETRRSAPDGLLLDGDEREAVIRGIEARTDEDSWLCRAALSVLLDPMGANAGGWVNGQHRGQAMIDAGVRQTLLLEAS
jgi:hypothetical protein